MSIANIINSEQRIMKNFLLILNKKWLPKSKSLPGKLNYKLKTTKWSFYTGNDREPAAEGLGGKEKPARALGSRSQGNM